MGRLRERSAAIAALGSAPPTPQRRLVAAAAAGLLTFALLLLIFRLFIGPSRDWPWFEALGAGIAAAVAAATTRIGRAIAYGLIAVFTFMLALVGMVFAAIGGLLS